MYASVIPATPIGKFNALLTNELAQLRRDPRVLTIQVSHAMVDYDDGIRYSAVITYTRKINHEFS